MIMGSSNSLFGRLRALEWVATTIERHIINATRLHGEGETLRLSTRLLPRERTEYFPRLWQQNPPSRRHLCGVETVIQM